MGTVIKELSRFSELDGPFKQYHSEVDGFGRLLESFLYSTMDEVRLKWAAELSREILRIIDYEDADYLREGVLKREATGTITYESQRDHTAHTLHNYLLGWYVYSNSGLYKKAMAVEILKRGWPNEAFGADEYFGHAWQYASLLHDVGYLLEGSLGKLDPDTQSSQAEVGVKIIKDYFESRLWLECDLSSVDERRLLLECLDVHWPHFESGQSLARIADTMRDLGDLRNLTKALELGLLERGESTAWLKPYRKTGLPRDAFDLWRLHLKVHKQPAASKRIDAVRGAFEGLLFKGLPSTGLRMLDHGVCSGLLILLASTYYYRLRYGIDAVTPKAGESERVLNKFKDRVTAYDYDPVFWWTGIVWGTGAAAIHNIQQSKRPWQGDVDSGKLALHEDPLAYLGILVDCLQDWDRYTVFPTLVSLPIQAVDVQLSPSATGVICLDYGRSDRAEKIRQELSRSLKSWDRIVSVTP